MTLAYDPSPTALLQPERADTLLRLGPPPSLDALALEAARLAYYRFDESAAEGERLTAALALAGFGPPRLFEHAATSGEAYGSVRADGLALLAVRGTQPERLRDLATDVHCVLRPWELGAGRVHAGFAAAALGLWPGVQAWLAQGAATRRELLVCGHSLGAAVASLLALPAGARHLVTLGSPRVGDAAFAAALDGCANLRQARYVNCCDLVTELPPALLGYAHAGSACYIDRDGVLQAGAGGAAIARDQLRARADYLARIALRGGALPARDLADHAPANYLRALYAGPVAAPDPAPAR
jgi:hypothetical protein